MTLEVTELKKSFDGQVHRIEVLRGVSFQLEKGADLVIVGPSGSGKSTLLHCIGTLMPPSSGSIHIDGLNPFGLAEAELARYRNSVIGFVFQDHYLLPQYSVLENVLLPTLAFPEENSDREERGRDLLEKVGLGHRLGHRPAEISGGERQRAAVARALVNRPGLLLCDEPTGNLDHETASTVADLLFRLHQEEGNTLIVVTHSMELAERFSRRLTLKEGLLREA